jgi:hypothetical protein
MTVLGAILAHLRSNVVAYVALFAALGGTSYAAVRLKPHSVTSAALAPRAVTHSKLARNSVRSQNVAPRSLTAADLAPGVVGPGPTGATGAMGPQGTPGGASVGVRARFSGSVTAPNGASTSVPLSANTWTQAANELDLLTGSMTVAIPASCTGSFGNALVANVDGTANTFAVGPSGPASATVTVPFVVGTLSEPSNATPHTVTASFANSCTKAGEDFKVSNVKLDVIRVP